MPDEPKKPEKPNSAKTYTEFGMEWQVVEPVAKSGGLAEWRIPLSSNQNKTGHTKHILEAMQRLFASLMVAFALGVLASIVVPFTRHTTISILSDAAALSLTHMGTTAVAVLLGLARFIQTRLPDWRSDMRKLWADIGKGASVTAIVWFGLFVFCLFEASNTDHQKMASTATSLETENNQLKSSNDQLKRDIESLKQRQSVPFDEPKTSLRRRTLKLVNDLTAFWSRRPIPLQPVQNPTTDEERARNSKADQYWRDAQAAYENANFRERILGIVREYKAKGIPTGYLEAAEQYNRLVGSAPFGGVGMEDCSRSQSDWCVLRELAYHVNAHDEPIFLTADMKD